MDLEVFFRDCLLIRQKSPLIHNITNYVAMNPSANALLAIGASPIMTFCKEEMDEIVSSADAVVINIGCLDMQQIGAMMIAADAAQRYGRPLILDPVGAGASSLRLETSLDIIRNYHPAIIRANASEVLSLALGKKSGRGVDATLNENTNKEVVAALGGHTNQEVVATLGEKTNREVNAIQAAKRLAIDSKSIVSMSGAIDCITDGETVKTISGGSPLMPKVTAMGCTASAITGAFAAVDDNYLDAAAGAMLLMKICGEKAASGASGTGTFACRFIDELSTFNPDEIVSSGLR